MSDLLEKPSEQMILAFALERQISEMPNQIDIEEVTEHAFCDGLYARTMRLPAFVAATGHIHRKESFFILREGTLLNLTENGVEQVYPGQMFVTRPGTKRAVFTMTDCVVTNIHGNPDNEREQAKLWDAYTIQPSAELLAYLETQKRLA